MKSYIEDRWYQWMLLDLERLKLEAELLKDANAGRVVFDPKQGDCGRWIEIEQELSSNGS